MKIEFRPSFLGKAYPIENHLFVNNPLVNPLLKSVSCVPPPLAPVLTRSPHLADGRWHSQGGQRPMHVRGFFVDRVLAAYWTARARLSTPSRPSAQ